MTVADDRNVGGGTGHREGSARSGRDLVLVVGLVGVVAGGAALMLRTARSTGSYLPVVLAALALLLGVGAVMSRRRRVAATRVRGRDRREWDAPAENGVGEVAYTIPLPDAGDHGTEILNAPPAPPPAVDSEALDHRAVDPDGFEHTVAALCARDGCSPVEVVGGAGDLGADVIATTPAGLRVVLQCKQYGEGHRVGSPDLQRFGGTCYAVHDADVAVLVTTSSFTDPALEYAASCGIVCVDGAELEAWTASTAPPPWAARAGDPAPGPRDGSPCDTA
ncbi:restriction endonuclease [Streptomyces filamentosus]|uniref:restriction endonuclease n=1 Tax=Streptomyces filamentosus TaxID=67294 RepID=UPI001239B07C|nr:restriction endonuclease [Streptomyces filamentosus]KAA6215682.1 restriction endonuclease [Streptomyces filamentosus]